MSNMDLSFWAGLATGAALSIAIGVIIYYVLV